MHELDSIRLHFSKDSLFLLNICLSFIMFGVALGLSLKDFKRVLTFPKLVLTGVTLQFLLLPVLTLAFVLVAQPLPSIALGLFMVAACPGGNISNFFSALGRGNVALSITLTAIATALAALMTPLNFNFWGGLYPETAALLKNIEISFLQLFETVLLLLGLPLVIGLWFKNQFPHGTQKIYLPIQRLSIGIFAIFIIVAFYNNLDIFFKYIHYVFLIVIFHNTLALLMGYYCGALFRFSATNKKTLALETGVQNTGLGLIIIFNFFESLGGMAILAAWWGIWDMLVGLLLAYYWSKRSKNQMSFEVSDS